MKIKLNKTGLIASAASAGLALIAVSLMSILPAIEDDAAEVATILGAIMATGFATVSAIIAVVAFLDR